MNKEQIRHVIPAVMARSYAHFTEQLDLVADIVPWVQIDVVDGSFGTNKTWPFTEGDAGDGKGEFSKIVRQEVGIPRWEDVEFEVDVMAQNPEFAVDQWIAAGASRVIVHKRNIDKESCLKLAHVIKDKGVEFMIAFEPSETIESVRDYVDGVAGYGLLDGIQCMGIDRVGFQNQEFNPKVLKLISDIHKEWPDLLISVDGAVSLDNARALVDAGASRLVSGSLIFESEMPRDTIERLEEVCGDMEF